MSFTGNIIGQIKYDPIKNEITTYPEINKNMFDLRNMDCRLMMKEFPDKHFDLSIIDPPYGIGEDGESNHSRNQLAQATKYTPKDWDKAAPSGLYFDELLRVSKNMIIFGANHFLDNLHFEHNTPCWIVWDKNNSGDFADCELAWTSFKTAVRKVKITWNGMLQEDMKNKETRIHPTQKPVALYKWILKNYAKPNDKILDTHLGSASIALAVHSMNTIEKMNLSLTGCEIDPDYFKESMERLRLSTKQTTIFDEV
jgi:site-specific DNA-methyltransferase (adenine-specific)